MASSSDAELLQQSGVKRQPLLAGEHGHETGAYPQIFLSYSRCEAANFARTLYDKLRNTNHEPFFDVESLQMGEKFPMELEKGAKNSRLGVVVVSEESMKSWWTMRELEIFTNNYINDNHFKILPVFYELRTADVKSPENIKRWKKEWENLKEKRSTIVPEEWEKMIISLLNWGGVEIPKGTEYKEYVDKIVRHICEAIPPPLLYDETQLKGANQLAEAVSKQFEAKSTSKARVIGLYGVGGLGKTTVCKIMANHFCREYLGRSEVMQFPNNGDDAIILDECKRVLRRLLSGEGVLRDVRDFDKAVQLMQEHMKRHEFFLAIDNVWQNSSDKAKRILECGFHPSSKVLVTSRSEDFLKELLKGCDNTSFSHLPGMEERAALLLLEGYNLEFSSEEVKRVLEVCHIGDSYHPLALKALGQQLERTMGVCGGDASRVKEMVFSEIGTSKLYDGPLTLLRDHFDRIPDLHKHIFLDVVLFAGFLCTYVEGNMYEIYPSILEWLSVLYEGKLSKLGICDILAQLQLDGLLGFKNDMRKVRVHELYEALARRVAEGDARFWFLRRDGLQAKKPKRVFLDSVSEKKVALPDCSEVELLLVTDGFKQKKFQLKGMRSLRLLKIRNNKLYKLDGVINLRHLELDGVHMLKHLDLRRARQLEMLHVVDCPHLKTIVGPRDPGNLQRVDIRRTPLLTDFPDWSAYTRLQDLRFIPYARLQDLRFIPYARLEDLLYVLEYLITMPRIVDLGRLTKLQCLDFGPIGIKPIVSVRGFETLTGLQHLSLTEVELGRGLANLRIRSCIVSRSTELEAERGRQGGAGEVCDDGDNDRGVRNRGRDELVVVPFENSVSFLPFIAVVIIGFLKICYNQMSPPMRSVDGASFSSTQGSGSFHSILLLYIIVQAVIVPAVVVIPFDLNYLLAILVAQICFLACVNYNHKPSQWQSAAGGTVQMTSELVLQCPISRSRTQLDA